MYFDDHLDFGDDSDPCNATDSSSDDDDLDIVLNGTPEQKRKFTVRCSKKVHVESSSEDEFEKEMNEELNDTVRAIEAERSGCRLKTEGKSTRGENSKSGDSVKRPGGGCDDIYFDSDEEEMITQGDKRVKRKNSGISNDDILYDPNMDDEDQSWVDNTRRNYQPKAKGKQKEQRPLPNSDAVLDCPACMCTLCRDCQRHDTFENQYRAMFVMNCSVDKTELLKYPKQQSKQFKKKSKKMKKSGDTSSGLSDDTVESEDMFHPVRCTECNTVVAVYDKDEVYHFFNVLASYG